MCARNRLSRRRRLGSCLAAEVALEARVLLAATLESGVTYSSAIESIGNVDEYTFTASAGDSIFYNLYEIDTEIEARITVVAPNGAILHNAHPSMAQIGQSVQLAYLAQSGTYSIFVSDDGSNDIGAYAHTFVRVPGNHILPHGEGLLTSGVTRENTLDAGDLDVFTFTASTGDSIFYNLHEIDTEMEARITIVAPNGAILHNAYPSMAQNGQSVQLPYLAQSGTYSIVVSDVGSNDIGAYAHTFVRVPGNHVLPQDEGLLTSGVTRENTLDAGDLDVFTFTASAGDSIFYNLHEIDTEMEARITVVAPNGAILHNAHPSMAQNGQSVPLPNLAQSGTYTIVVSDDGSNDVGRYSHELTLERSATTATSLIGFVNGNWWMTSANTNGNYSNHVAASGPASSFRQVLQGDFNGDGLQDVAAWLHNGQWQVGLANGSGRFTFSTWTTWTHPNIKEVHVGDFNEDGVDDIIGLFKNGDRGRWWVGQSNGTRFINRHWGDYGNYNGIHSVLVGNFDGVKGDDLTVIATSGVVWMVKTSNTRFQYLNSHRWNLSNGFEFAQVGNFNEDTRDDVLAVFGTGVNRSVFVAKSTGPATGFHSSKWSDWTVNQSLDAVVVGDFDGDGRSNVAALFNGTKLWYGKSNGTSFAMQFWLNWSEVSGGIVDVSVGDTNGDGLADILGRTSNGAWHTAESTGQGLVDRVFARWSPTASWQHVMSGTFTYPSAAMSEAAAFEVNQAVSLESEEAPDSEDYAPFGAPDVIDLLFKAA